MINDLTMSKQAAEERQVAESSTKKRTPMRRKKCC